MLLALSESVKLFATMSSIIDGAMQQLALRNLVQALLSASRYIEKKFRASSQTWSFHFAVVFIFIFYFIDNMPIRIETQ